MTETLDPWRSRGYLPHFDQPGSVQSITFRLADAIPRDAVDALRRELGNAADAPALVHERISAWLDAGAGRCELADARAAAEVERAILHFDGERYRVIAWCVMPNHVHVLIETAPGHALARVVHSWKSYTATRINEALGRTGPLWMREYHDRFIRDDRHLLRVVEYIEWNPVKAGLVETPAQWRFSSAWNGRA